MPTSQIFFSYSRADSNFALRLATNLRDAGVNLWLDQLDIPAGNRWDIEIEKALQKCNCMVVILSVKAIASHNVMDEISYGLDEGKKIIPIIINDCALPFRLRRLQHIDFSQNYDQAFVRLLNAVNFELKEDKTEELYEKDNFENNVIIKNSNTKEKELTQEIATVSESKTQTIEPSPVIGELKMYRENTSKPFLKSFEYVNVKEWVSRSSTTGSKKGDLYIYSDFLRVKISKEVDFIISDIVNFDFVVINPEFLYNYLRVVFLHNGHNKCLLFYRIKNFTDHTAEMHDVLLDLTNQGKFKGFKK